MLRLSGAGRRTHGFGPGGTGLDSDLVRELLAESIAALGMQALPRTRPEFRTFAAGPGWADVELPPRVVLLTSLLQATDLIGAAIL